MNPILSKSIVEIFDQVPDPREVDYCLSPLPSLIYLLNAWVAENRLCIRQQRGEAKSKEITAIQTLLEELTIEGSTITIDAMGCQTDIAQLIIEKKADYLLAVKGNQPILLEEIEDCFRFKAKEDS